MASKTASVLVVAKELDWLKDNPDFTERPASISEFLGPDYLNVDDTVRPGLRQVLVDIFGEESNPHSLAAFQEAMMTGAIGIGKTTFGSIVLPYMVHWVLCLKNPQKYFSLMPGTRIAFMMMSTSEDQAREVIFGDVFARIDHSPWFKAHPYDKSFKNQIRFPEKDIWIIPGDSAETTFEGYNILGGILDEMDSHRVTLKKDYALEGYNTISNRITSRFQDRGLLILIGQMKKSVGFAANMYRKLLDDKGAYVSRMTIWESFGWDKYLKPDGTRDSFWFDCRRKTEISAMIAAVVDNKDFLEIPNFYKKRFMNDPDKALKDLAGIPPAVGNPYIGMTDKIQIAQTAWHMRHGEKFQPVLPLLDRAEFSPMFRCKDSLRRVVHIDIAYSDQGDALGLAMGHIRELKLVDGELMPYIVFDFLLRMRPVPGREIILSDIRKIIYQLKDELRFKIKKVTLDGFQSTDTIQQLNKRHINADYLSVDRNIGPYEDLRDALYEGRLEFPRYMVPMSHSDPKLVDISYQELSQLIDNGKKIDHPVGGSKDVADAMAGCCYTLMDDREFRRGVSSNARQQDNPDDDRVRAYDPTSSLKDPSGKTLIPAVGSLIPPSLVPPANLTSVPGIGPGGSSGAGGILDGIDLDSLRKR